MNKLVLTAWFLLLATGAFAQIQTVTIQDIQTVSQMDLQNCEDVSPFLDDTVTVRGVVVTPGGLANSADGRQIWIQNGTGPFSGIDVRFGGGNMPTTPDDILDLVQGDSVEITGLVERFGRETQLNPLQNGVEVVGLSDIAVREIPISDLNDDQRNNILPTGEQWEGSYVELIDVTVTSVDFFSGGTRVSFNVSDANGNLVNISDRFDAQRIANGFVPPVVGTVYDTLRGVVAHSANGCTGDGGRGYELFPFDQSDYVVRFGPPVISAITRNPNVPTSSQDVTIQANIRELDTGTVVSATLFYAVGIGNTNYLSVPMNDLGGDTYEGTISSGAYSDGDYVKFYIRATDNDNTSSFQPNVPGMADPIIFVVRDNGLTIYDVQFTPFNTGNSIYVNSDVTVTGIVTASDAPNNLGIVFIQQSNTSQLYTGLSLAPGTANITGLEPGDSIQVNGTVRESFGLTQLEVNQLTNLGTAGIPAATVINPDDFTTADNSLEPFESMLVRAENPAGGPIYVVEKNADGPNNNFAEYRIGTDLFNTDGLRVLTGRVTNSAFGSLNVSYINDSTFITDDGALLVDPCVVNYGDSVDAVTGIMYYSFGNFKLLPRNNDDYTNYSGANCPDGITSSIGREFASSQLVVFPNPAATELNLRWEFPRAARAQFSLVDLTGRRVASQLGTARRGESQLSLGQLANGLYLLTVEVEGTVIAREKVMVRR